MNIWIGVLSLAGATLVGVAIAYRANVGVYMKGWVERHIVADDPFDDAMTDVPGLVDARRRHPSQHGAPFVPAVWVSVCPSCGRPVRRGPLDEHVCQRRGVQS